MHQKSGLNIPPIEVPKHILEAKLDPEAIAYSPDGHLLAACDMAGPIVVWNVSTGRCLTIYGDKSLGARAVAFSPGSALLATALTNGTVRLFETATWHQVAICIGHEQEIYALDFSVDGKYLVSGCRPGGKTIVWDTGNWRSVQSFEQFSASRSLSFSPSGKLLAVPSGNSLSIYEVGTWYLVKKLSFPRLVGADIKEVVVCFAFSPDGATLILCTDSGSIGLWSTQDWQHLMDLTPSSHGHTTCAFSPDGMTFAVGGSERSELVRSFFGTRFVASGGTIRLWETKEWQPIKEFETGTHGVFSLRFSPAGDVFATCHEGGGIFIWEYKMTAQS